MRAHPMPFEAYVAPARARPQLWRLGLGMVLLVVANLALAAGLVVLLRRAGLGQAIGPERLGDTPGVMLLVLLSFVGLAGGTLAAARLLHGRGLRSLIGHGPTALRHFAAGAALVLAVNAAGLALVAPRLDLAPNLAPAQWLALLPLALAGVALQTGAEELAFRGYLQQQLAARFASPLVWMVLPSIGFALLHHDPGTMGPNTWAVVALTGVFGLMAADLTARSGTLGLAWGLHFANNLVVLLGVAPAGALSGLALYTTPFGPDDPGTMRALLAADLMVMLLIWALCRQALRRG